MTETAGEYLRNRLYHADGGVFKLNLFPLACARDSRAAWPVTHQQQVGFDTKNGYADYCVQHRGPFFRHAIAQYRPRVILCTGVGRRPAFLNTIVGNEHHPGIVHSLNGAMIHVYEGLPFQLVISPFPGNRAGSLRPEGLVGLGELIDGWLHPGNI